MEFRRYAVYFAPASGPLEQFGASWLGWDIATGRAVPQPDLGGLPAPLPEITATPRKYGFHATIKPPFRLADGCRAEDLANALEALCVQMTPQTLEGLELAPLGRFLALVARGDLAGLNGMAAMVVDTLDSLRAPPTEAELAKRRAGGLSPRQDALLQRWGYPYVMDQFRFHMTLTGKLPKAQVAQVQTVAARALNGLLPAPFVVDGLSLVGEAEDGRFHLIHRHTLSM